MAILLKTASVRVSSIQIMQVRVQNKGKIVWKSRYVGDVLDGGVESVETPCLSCSDGPPSSNAGLNSFSCIDFAL